MPTTSRRPLEILWLATKSPWPSVDGGRLLMARTLAALDPGRVRVTLVHPAEPDGGGTEASAPALARRIAVPEGGHTVTAALAAVPSLVGLGAAPTVAVRHRREGMRAAVVDALATGSFDVVHAEQPHSLSSLPSTDLPVLLRMQNVETDLWRSVADGAPRLLRPWFRRQAHLVRRWELEAARRVDHCAAISAEDRDRLVALGVHRDTVSWLPPAFPHRLPGGDRSLPGEPALVLLATSTWSPNRDGVTRFLEHVWPAIHRGVPGARLHVFGDEGARRAAGITLHPAPREWRQVFAPDAVLVVPARVTSGIRMKILESWARGVPVLATPASLRGLDDDSLRSVDSADSPPEWCRAVAALCDPDRRRQQVDAGRTALQTIHRPERVADQLAELYGALTRRPF